MSERHFFSLFFLYLLHPSLFFPSLPIIDLQRSKDRNMKWLRFIDMLWCPRRKNVLAGFEIFLLFFDFSSASPVVVAVDWGSKGKIGGGLKENVGGREWGVRGWGENWMDRNAFMHIPYCSTGVPQEQFVTQSCVRETVNKNWSMKEKLRFR